MNEVLDKIGYTGYYLFTLATLWVRYILMAGAAYLFIWIIYKEKLKHKIIQKRLPEKDKIFHELKYSAITLMIFAASGILVLLMKQSGMTLIYDKVEDYGVPYMIFSIIAIIFLHDTYFYWTHRLMHHPILFKRMHLVHHKSTNPSPWAAFSFHPYEAVVEAGIVPLVILFLPIHTVALVIFFFYSNFLNVLGHLSFELFPKGFIENKFLRLHNSTTHHNMHHKYFNCNYGLYFNIWDRIMGTNHERYFDTFREVTHREPEHSSDGTLDGSPEIQGV
ncbi:sterol desaturase family protein [Leptospira langatensis]|uniref:Sterol desaturase family protein n=1 Tax=Leptospira langatensis TaxID=2484983 RepID=A0A5F1ZVN3_9LEPT|nr:sterol desaturase family protein [Leptospira langatensis]TGK00033.1 sterol desaturase family protein [Leptospira langatensis]TGL42668.1 sterol desaturase family protein [Leptospira langatensis]